MIGPGPRARGALGPSALGYAAAWTALAGLALAGVRNAEAAHAWAAGALGAALLLDAGARLAARAMSPGGRGAPLPQALALPALVLAIGEAAGLALGLVLLVALPEVLPGAFPVLASALAGLVTIGATARIVMVVTFRRLVRAAAEETRTEP